jgi:hypothetical protein
MLTAATLDNDSERSRQWRSSAVSVSLGCARRSLKYSESVNGGLTARVQTIF